MTLALFSVVAGIALLFYGATALVRGASGLARALGVAPAVIGLTVVAFGTSLPELVVSATAALKGSGDIALGNVVGSNIANIGLILGVAAAIRAMTVEFTLVRREVPMGIGAVALVAGLAADGTLGRGDGAVLLVGFGAFLYWSVGVARGSPGEVPSVALPSEGSRSRNAALTVAGLAGVVLGGQLLVDGAVAVAAALGVPAVIIGLTVVAVGTSLPEMAASVVAVARGEDDLGVGNVLGSNLFNLLGILGVAALLQPIAVSDTFFRLQFPVLAAFTLALLPICRLGSGISRVEGGVLLTAYGAYVAALFLVPGVG